MWVLSPLGVANHHVLSPPCLVANPRFSLLASSIFKPFPKNKHEMFCFKSSDLVHTCMLCASRSKLANNLDKNTFVYQTTYHVSRGRSLIGRAGVLISGLSLLEPKFQSRGNFGDDGHVALGMSQGFLNFPKLKYLGSDSVSGKAVHVWHFFAKIYFSKRFSGFGLCGSN